MSNLPANPAVIEATAENFIAEVIERSKLVPVVVDFWAEWCQPCRILGPILEKLAAESAGKFVLVKAETEKVPEIAASFQVRSIPAVFAVKGGQVVDSFVGVAPEPALRAWIDRILPTPAETLRIAAQQLEPTDLEAAETKYREALALEPNEALTKISLARVALARGLVEESASIIHDLERRGFLEPEAETVKAGLTLHGTSKSGDLDRLRAAHQALPDDNPTQLELAEALASASLFEEALPLALELVERDRKATGETARKLMIAAFQVLPPDSSLAHSYRRKLSFAL